MEFLDWSPQSVQKWKMNPKLSWKIPLETIMKLFFAYLLSYLILWWDNLLKQLIFYIVGFWKDFSW